jgi:hypothetical protein
LFDRPKPTVGCSPNGRRRRRRRRYGIHVKESYLAIGVSIHRYWSCKSCVQDRILLIVKIKIKSRIVLAKAAFNRKKFFFLPAN